MRGLPTGNEVNCFSVAMMTLSHPLTIAVFCSRTTDAVAVLDVTFAPSAMSLARERARLGVVAQSVADQRDR